MITFSFSRYEHTGPDSFHQGISFLFLAAQLSHLDEINHYICRIRLMIEFVWTFFRNIFVLAVILLIPVEISFYS